MGALVEGNSKTEIIAEGQARLAKSAKLARWGVSAGW